MLSKDEPLVAKVVTQHGVHGPKPLFEGDRWTVSYTCSHCDSHINPDYEYCPYCGALLLKEVKEPSHYRVFMNKPGFDDVLIFVLLVMVFIIGLLILI